VLFFVPSYENLCTFGTALPIFHAASVPQT
jgi:hypothetical protein